MGSGKGGKRWGLPLLIVMIFLTAPSTNGQLQSVVTALLGGNSATPTSTQAAQSSPTSTPTASDTPVATSASTSAPTDTPAASAAASSTTPVASTASTTDAVSDATPTDTAKATPAAATTPVTAAPTTITPNTSTLNTTGSTPRASVKARAPPPAPPPPVPVVIDQTKLVNALPADETQPLNASAPAAGDNSGRTGLTAADMVLQVSGSGVTPFVIPQQSILLRAMASVLTTVSLGDLRVRYVTSSANLGRRLLSESVPQAHRSLLQDSGAAAAAKVGNLYNVATVTLEANCSSEQAVPATLTEMQSVMANQLLASALQFYNASWGVQFLSLTSVDPTVALDLGKTCRKRLGTFCLDNTSLSVSAAEAIIGIGCFFVIMLICIPCVLLEWKRRSGRMVELDPTPETPKSPLQKVQNMYNNMISTVKQASPLHRKRSSAPNPFRETPRSASNVKPETGARIQLHASSQ